MTRFPSLLSLALTGCVEALPEDSNADSATESVPVGSDCDNWDDYCGCMDPSEWERTWTLDADEFAGYLDENGDLGESQCTQICEDLSETWESYDEILNCAVTGQDSSGGADISCIYYGPPYCEGRAHGSIERAGGIEAVDSAEAWLARAAHAEIKLNSEATSISSANGKWHVDTKTEHFSASVLINASGAWADKTAALSGITPLGFIPYRRSIARIPVPGGFDPSDWPLFDEINERWYAKPDAGQLIVSPADEDPLEPQDAWADDMVLAEGIARFEKMITHPVERMTTNWAGLRTFSPDRSLVIGSASENRQFFWLCGQGGYGFQTAAAASRLAADLILGRQCELSVDLCAALSPDRFS